MIEKKRIHKRLIDQLLGIDLLEFDRNDFLKFKNKKILITGCSGLIGLNILFCLQKISIKKKITINIDGTYNTYIFPFIINYFKKFKKIKFLKMDLTKKKIKKKYDYIFHCAGYGQPSKFLKDKQSTYDLNSSVVSELHENLKKNGQFIYFSTSEIYSGNNKICLESSHGFTGPYHPRSPYIDSKKFAESLIVNKFENYLIFRVSLTYGHGAKLNDERVLNQVILRSIKNKFIDVFGGLNQLRSNLYIDDAITMIIKTTGNYKNDIFNLNNHKMMTLSKIFDLIGEISNKKIIHHKPKFIGSPMVIKISNKKILNLLRYKIKFNNKSGIIKTRDWYQNLLKA